MQEQSWKVTLPGLMHERSGLWWWEVRLPGEDQAKARPLNVPPGSSFEIAEKAAITLWEQAVVRDGARQLLLDCTQQVERFKAQLLDKLRQLTEVIQSATERAHAETQARIELQSRLNAMIAAAGWNPQDLVQSMAVPTSDIQDSCVHVGDSPTDAESGFCEGCGAASILISDLAQIDSGQFLCPDCLRTLHVDALRAELDHLTEHLA